MYLRISQGGTVTCLYDETIDLNTVGSLDVTRASWVKWNHEMQAWYADLGQCDGPLLGPFKQRSQALEAEKQWLEINRIASVTKPSTP